MIVYANNNGIENRQEEDRKKTQKGYNRNPCNIFVKIQPTMIPRM